MQKTELANVWTSWELLRALLRAILCLKGCLILLIKIPTSFVILFKVDIYDFVGKKHRSLEQGESDANEWSDAWRNEWASMDYLG